MPGGVLRIDIDSLREILLCFGASLARVAPESPEPREYSVLRLRVLCLSVSTAEDIRPRREKAVACVPNR